MGSAEGEACALGKCIGNVINGVGEGKGDIVHKGFRNPKLCDQSSSARGRVMLEEMKMLFRCLRTEMCMDIFLYVQVVMKMDHLNLPHGNSDSNDYEKDEAIMLLLFC